MKIFSLIIVLILIPLLGMTQVSQGGRPVGLSDAGFKRLSEEKYSLPEIRSVLKSTSVDLDAIRHKTLKFAQTFPVDLTPQNAGSWSRLSNGSKVWRLLIESDGAKTLNIIFSKFKIPDGATLFVYNPDMTDVLGSFTSKNNKISGALPVMPVEGDQLVVEYTEPFDAEFVGELEIGKVNHDYIGINKVIKAVSIGNFGSSQECEVNIGCEAGWEVQDRSVIKMIVDGSELCTGALVNNTAEDGTPYVLTAAHCFADHSFKASGTIFIFNYQVPNCYNTIEGSREQTVAGGYMRAYSEQDEFKDSDYALVEMSVKPPKAYRSYYSGWNATSDMDSNVVAIHHPNGDVKKISHDYDEVDITSLIVNNFYYRTYSHWWVKDWESGVTEGGSSGCPLYSKDGLIIGALSAGQASCNNMVNDFFYALSKVWTAHSDQTRTLKYWLDPLNTGQKILGGLRPEGYEKISRLSNIQKDEGISTISLGSNGYLGGFNKVGLSRYAEHYQLDNGDTSKVLGMYFIPELGATSSASNIIFKVWEGGTLPGDELWSKQVYIKEWLRTQTVDGTVSKFGDTGGFYTKSYYEEKENFIFIPDDVYGGNDFYIGYEIVNNGPVDTFALYAANDRAAGLNTALYFDGDGWNTFANYDPNPVFTSLYLDPVIQTFEILSDTTIPTQFNKIVKYIEPSPAIGETFTLHFNEPLSEDGILSIFTLNGMKVSESMLPQGSMSVDKAFVTKARGIYIIRISYKGKTEVHRIVNLAD